MSTTVLQIPTVALHPHPANPRRDLGDLVELADSMRAHGVRQALVAVPHCPTAGECTMRVKTSDGTVWCTAHQLAGELRVVIGHRRLAAARMADLPDVPTVIDHDLTAAEQLELMLVENVQRADLTPIEEANGYQGLLDLDVPITMIAKRTGRARSTVTSRLKLLALSDEARAKVDAGQASLEDAATLAHVAEKAPDLVAELEEAFGTPSLSWRARYAQEVIDRRERLPELIAAVEAAGATVWEPVDEEGNPILDHEIDLDDYTYNTELVPGKAESLPNDGQLTDWRFYVDTDRGYIHLYRPDPVYDTGGEAADPAAAAERAARQEAARLRDQLRNTSDLAYTRRTEFVQALLKRRKWSADDTDAIGTSLAYMTTTRSIYMHPHASFFGIESRHGWDASLADLPWQAVAVACLHVEAGAITGLYTGTVGSPGEGASSRVQDFYQLLEQLGYVMSDDERHYIYGEPFTPETVEG